MPITAQAPAGGIVEQLGGESRPLVLRNGEIERFERQHDIGIFTVLSQLLGEGDPKASQCRDLVALGLVGGGLADKSADRLIDDMPPHENTRIRSIAQDLIFAAFVPPEDKKKAGTSAGSSGKTGPKGTTRKPRSKTPSAQG